MARDRRRRNPHSPRSLVAAASRIKLADKRLAQKQAARREQWQDDAWSYFDDVPEIKYSTWWLGNQMAKLRLFVGTMPADGGPDADPVPVSDPAAGQLAAGLAEQAELELGRLNTGLGGLPGIQRQLNMNVEVAAECYLIVQGARENTAPEGEPDNSLPERWSVRSVSEVEVLDGTYKLKDGPNDTSPTVLDAELDDAIRMWQPHPRWSSKADCAMRGVLGECDSLVVLSNQIKAEGRSRQAAGMLTVPSELSFGPPDPTEGDEGEEQSDPFSEELLKALSEAIIDPSSAASVMPLVVRGPAEYLQPHYLRHITLDRKGDSVLDERIEKRVQRIARGLNLPVEVVMGHQETTYANAEQVDEDAYEDHLEPRAILIADMLTIGVLRPQLLEAGFSVEDANRVFVWFDPAALIRQPDADANADAGHEKGTISDQAWRRARGFSEDDAPSDEERLIRLGLQRGQVSAPLTVALIKALSERAGIELPDPKDVQAERPAAPAPASIQTVGDLAALLVGNGRFVEAVEAQSRSLTRSLGRRRSNLGAHLMGIDRDLRTRLITACDAAMSRAIERAGNRLKAKPGDTGYAVRRLPAHLAAAHLGPQMIRAAGSDPDHLLDAEFDSLEGRFMVWGAAAQADALGLVASSVTLSDGQVQTTAAQQANDLAEAWQWLKAELIALGTTRLFNPNPDAPPAGEYDGSTAVPAGLVRQAIARAGGATGMQDAGAGGAWVAIIQGGTEPAGGIGTGQLLDGLLSDGGASTEGYRWVYGPAHRSQPFEEHLALDGVEFPNFDHDSLGNDDSWPPFSYYMPGDHAGCLCDFEPIIAIPEVAA